MCTPYIHTHSPLFTLHSKRCNAMPSLNLHASLHVCISHLTARLPFLLPSSWNAKCRVTFMYLTYTYLDLYHGYRGFAIPFDLRA